MKARELGVWLGGSRVATFRSKTPGRVESRYSEYALDTWDGNTPVLSYSLSVDIDTPALASIHLRVEAPLATS